MTTVGGEALPELSAYVPAIGFAGYFQYAGASPTPLSFAASRVYQPTLGRWLNRDPMDPMGMGPARYDGPGFNATDLNLYTYAGNNPATLADPSGNCPMCIGAAIGAGVGAVLGYYAYYASTPAANFSWSGAALASVSGAALGAVAGGTGAALGVLAGGGSLAGAFGISDTAALAGVSALGSVTSGGKLDQVLDSISSTYGAVQPTNALQAVTVVQQATSQVGLGAGIGGLQPNGQIVFQNVGGVLTTIGTDGSILIQKGGQDLLHLCP